MELQRAVFETKGAEHQPRDFVYRRFVVDDENALSRWDRSKCRERCWCRRIGELTAGDR